MENEHAADGTRRDLVVIGASAGGIEALRGVVGHLSADLPAAICVVLHVSASTPSALAGILGRAGPLPSRPAHDGDALVPGEILVAPPDRHLVVEDGHVRLSVGPRENNHRPSIDVLFRSAAESAGARVIGVVLSGMLDDGAAGLAVIKAAGGLAFVQDPGEALHPGMPMSAIANVAVDEILPCNGLARAITAAAWGGDPPDPPAAVPPPIPGDALTIVCPECGGVLSETTEADVPRWRCHVGHLYSPGSLSDAQGTELERALWTALRTLRDRAALLRRLAELAQARGHGHSRQRFHERADDAESQADAVLGVLRDSAASATDIPDVVAEGEEVA